MGERNWQLGQWDEHLGYDCMTGGVRVGPVFLDGADYGQHRCQPIQPADKARLLEDARLIAAAPDMFGALKAVNKLISEAAMTGFNCHNGDWAERLYFSQQATSRAIAKAEGRANLADANTKDPPTSPLHGESGT